MYLLIIIRWSLAALLVIAGVVVPQFTSVQAQDATEVKKAVNRLQNECDKVIEATDTCKELLNKGKNIFDKKLAESYAQFVQHAESFLGFVVDAPVIKAAMLEHKQPPFDPLWRLHQLSRKIAKGLAPDEDRCAIALSMTLNLRPLKEKGGDASLVNLGDLWHKIKQWRDDLKNLKIPEKHFFIQSDTDLATRFYIKAEQLAYRLIEEWGSPVLARGEESVKKLLLNKRGVVFFKGGFGV